MKSRTIIARVLLLGSVLVGMGCQSTYKIVVEDDLNKSKVIRSSDNATHTVFGFMNFNRETHESRMCQNARWKTVTSEQKPIWSAIRVGSIVAGRVSSFAGGPTPFLYAGTAYSQFETKWECSRANKKKPASLEI